MTAFEPFRIEISDAALADLRGRLARTRWPESETVDDWSQGIPVAYVRELCDYWAVEYDWRATERRLNAIPQFRTELDGLQIHFLHARSTHEDALPLLITHGWPGSVIEFLEVIDPLTDPTAHGGERGDAFHVVCPSLPGYGFSDKPATAGWGVGRIASAWTKLMARLGYERYGVQGGDWGGVVTMQIGAGGGEQLAGIHVNTPLADPNALRELGELTVQEQAALASFARYRRWDSGYSKSSRRVRRPSATGWSTRRLPCARGSLRSSGPGPTATGIPRTPLGAISCSTT